MDPKTLPQIPPSPAEVGDLILQTREHVQSLGWGNREHLYPASQVRKAIAAAYAAGMDRAAEVCDALKMGRPGHSAAHDVVLYRGDCAAAIRAAKGE